MTPQADTQEMTLLEAITRRLRACRAVPDGVEPPAAILWTDPDRLWLPLLGAVRARLPELLVLGTFDSERRTGPAIWLRCVVDRTLELPGLPEDQVPVIYLPGVGRQHLRAGEDCPRGLKPLVELMYRGTLWLQKGGHDWTVTAFLTSPHGLGLDLARDDETLQALPRTLREVAETPLMQLRGRRLEAEDFDRLLTTDLCRDLLQWMSDSSGWRERVGPERWAAFCSQSRAQLEFDPSAEGELVAGRRLGMGEGTWANAWDRYQEAPQVYPGIPGLLRKSKPVDLFVERSRWPDENESSEEALRAALREILSLPRGEACARIEALETEHGERREWVWARMGLAPLARVLEPLAVLAGRARSTIGGATPQEIARTYAEGPWRADAASWKALSLAPTADEGLIQDVIRCLLESWLEDSARVFQSALEHHPLPTSVDAEGVTAPEGGCIVFADGLRYDLGQELSERLEARGCRVHVSHRWSALPTVTATAKPAVTPISGEISGGELPEDFAPFCKRDKKTANAARLRSEMERAGYQVLRGDLGDWPASDQARGWSEEGEIDSLGHKLELGLARQVDAQLDRLAEKILGLLEGGWTSVRVVTDHGWLLLPGGLPKVDLPKYLTASRWSRCATLAGASQLSAPTAPWHWNPAQRFATAPGIACFNASPAYAHGGLSIQECLTPELLVERVGGGGMRATIRSVTWRGMRCVVEASVSGGEVQADLRLGQALGPSIVASLKAMDEEGRASLVVPNDTHEGATATLVLLGGDGAILAQQTTRVGEAT
jgi:hypothetical protein